MLLLTSFLLLWTLLGYPLLMLALAALWPRLRGNASPPPPSAAVAATPLGSAARRRIAVVIPACNEAEAIPGRLANLFGQEPPPEWVVVVSDGSTDATHAIAAGYPDRRVIALPPQPERRGKMAALQRGAEALRSRLQVGDLLLFTDANALFAPHTISRLEGHFADPRLGALGGVRATTPETLVGRAFRCYESALLAAESRVGSALGAAGEILALRAELAFQLLPQLSPATTNDDFALAMAVVAAGFRHRIDPTLLATEPLARHARLEFWRRLRIAAGRARDLLRGGWPPSAWVRFQIVSHKGLRLLIPWLLLAPLGRLLALPAPPGAIARGIALLFLLAAGIGFALPTATTAASPRPHSNRTHSPPPPRSGHLRRTCCALHLTATLCRDLLVALSATAIGTLAGLCGIVPWPRPVR